MTTRTRIAAAQIEPRLMRLDENLNRILEATREAEGKRAQLVVFPECTLTGYIFNSREEAMACAQTIPGPSTETIASLCRELNTYVAYGLLEKDNGRLFNAAALVGPKGVIGGYRKNHLPFQGVDRFVDPGDKPFQVHRTGVGNIGLLICYDIVFPESSRIMTLLGADIIVLSTNFPKGPGERVSRYVINARAFENKVHVVSCSRVGVERESHFCGMSKIVACSGDTIAEADIDEEETIHGEVNLESARRKHIVFSPGEWEVDQMNDRRPELYGLLAESKPGTR